MLIYLFEDMSGLSINFQKSMATWLEGNDAQECEIASMFNCKLGSFPLFYLGMPIRSGRLLG